MADLTNQLQAAKKLIDKVDPSQRGKAAQYAFDQLVKPSLSGLTPENLDKAKSLFVQNFGEASQEAPGTQTPALKPQDTLSRVYHDVLPIAGGFLGALPAAETGPAGMAVTGTLGYGGGEELANTVDRFRGMSPSMGSLSDVGRETAKVGGDAALSGTLGLGQGAVLSHMVGKYLEDAAPVSRVLDLPTERPGETVPTSVRPQALDESLKRHERFGVPMLAQEASSDPSYTVRRPVQVATQKANIPAVREAILPKIEKQAQAFTRAGDAATEDALKSGGFKNTEEAKTYLEDLLTSKQRNLEAEASPAPEVPAPEPAKDLPAEQAKLDANLGNRIQHVVGSNARPADLGAEDMAGSGRDLMAEVGNARQALKTKLDTQMNDAIDKMPGDVEIDMKDVNDRLKDVIANLGGTAARAFNIHGLKLVGKKGEGDKGLPTSWLLKTWVPQVNGTIRQLANSENGQGAAHQLGEVRDHVLDLVGEKTGGRGAEAYGQWRRDYYDYIHGPASRDTGEKNAGIGSWKVRKWLQSGEHESAWRDMLSTGSKKALTQRTVLDNLSPENRMKFSSRAIHHAVFGHSGGRTTPSRVGNLADNSEFAAWLRRQTDSPEKTTQILAAMRQHADVSRQLRETPKAARPLPSNEFPPQNPARIRGKTPSLEGGPGDLSQTIYSSRFDFRKPPSAEQLRVLRRVVRDEPASVRNKVASAVRAVSAAHFFEKEPALENGKTYASPREAAAKMDRAKFSPEEWAREFPEMAASPHREGLQTLDSLRKFRTLQLASDLAESKRGSISQAASTYNAMRSPTSHGQESTHFAEPLAAIAGAAVGGPIGAGAGAAVGHALSHVTRHQTLTRMFDVLARRYGDKMAGDVLINQLVRGRRLPPEQQILLHRMINQMRNGAVPWGALWTQSLVHLMNGMSGNQTQQK